MALYTEKTKANNHIVRFYNQTNVYITYALVNDTVEVYLLHSLKPGKGNARMAFTHFCHELKNKDIKIRVSSDFDADLDKLHAFYMSLGFKQNDSDPSIYMKGKQVFNG